MKKLIEWLGYDESVTRDALVAALLGVAMLFAASVLVR